MTDSGVAKIETYVRYLRKHQDAKEWLMLALIAHEIVYEASVICGKARIIEQVEKADLEINKKRTAEVVAAELDE